MTPHGALTQISLYCYEAEETLNDKKLILGINVTHKQTYTHIQTHTNGLTLRLTPLQKVLCHLLFLQFIIFNILSSLAKAEQRVQPRHF